MNGDSLRDLARRAGLRDVSPSVVLAFAVACAVVLAWTAWRWSVSSNEVGFVVETADEASVESAGGGATGRAGSSETSIVVHVTGAVAREGVVELPAGSRVKDALDACGGMLGNAASASVNLARQLVDGEQVVVMTRDEVSAAESSRGTAGARSGGLLDVNRASEAELEELPGIGPATAAKIVEDREANGPFGSIEDLQRVPGIGPKKLKALEDLIVVR